MIVNAVEASQKDRLQDQAERIADVKRVRQDLADRCFKINKAINEGAWDVIRDMHSKGKMACALKVADYSFLKQGTLPPLDVLRALMNLAGWAPLQHHVYNALGGFYKSDANEYLVEELFQLFKDRGCDLANDREYHDPCVLSLMAMNGATEDECMTAIHILHLGIRQGSVTYRNLSGLQSQLIHNCVNRYEKEQTEAKDKQREEQGKRDIPSRCVLS